MTPLFPTLPSAELMVVIGTAAELRAAEFAEEALQRMIVGQVFETATAEIEGEIAVVADLLGPGLDAHRNDGGRHCGDDVGEARSLRRLRSEEHTSELQSIMRIQYAVICLQK